MLIFQAPATIPSAWYINAKQTAQMPQASGRMGLITFRNDDFARVMEWSKRLKKEPRS